MKSTGLKAKKGGLIIAANDQSLPTKYYQANIIKTDQTQYVDSERKKQKQTKSIDPFVFSCPILASIEYKEKYVL